MDTKPSGDPSPCKGGKALRFIRRRGEFIAWAAKGNTEVHLLARADGVEVMWQRVAGGAMFYLDSADEWQGFEFIYVLSGKISYIDVDPPVTLCPGDYIARHPTPKRAWFQAVEDTELLYVSSRPAFGIVEEEIREFLEIVRAVEADEELEGHSRRVAGLAVAVGRELGLTPERLADLAHAALLHDVGKARIPPEILRSPRPLSPEEWEMVKRHPIWGREELERKPCLRRAARIVEQTHERYDGTGYPHGLKGEGILLEARIIAAADAYDAMASDRPYRRALSHREAVAELRAGAGTQFDPRVVEALVRVLERGFRSGDHVTSQP